MKGSITKERLGKYKYVTSNFEGGYLMEYMISPDSIVSFL